MRYFVSKGMLALYLLLAAALPAAAQGQAGEKAADFPPGIFNDGKTYHLGDMAGKLVVLYFFESK